MPGIPHWSGLAMAHAIMIIMQDGYYWHSMRIKKDELGSSRGIDSLRYCSSYS